MNRLNYQIGAPDATDKLILCCLAENARQSNAAIARRAGLSAPSVAERIRRLEESGVITGYTARIAPEAIGYPIGALLRIRPVPGELHLVADLIRDTPEITACDRVTGDDCFVAQVNVTSVAHLEEVIDRLIPHAMTNTAIIQSSPVAGRLPPLDGR